MFYPQLEEILQRLYIFSCSRTHAGFPVRNNSLFLYAHNRRKLFVKMNVISLSPACAIGSFSAGLSLPRYIVPQLPLSDINRFPSLAFFYLFFYIGGHLTNVMHCWLASTCRVITPQPRPFHAYQVMLICCIGDGLSLRYCFPFLPSASLQMVISVEKTQH